MMEAMRGSAHVLAVPDAERTARWWVEVMGFEIAGQPEGWVFVRSGKVTIMLGSCPDAIHPRDLGDHQYFGYLEVADVDAWFDAVSSRGAEILFPPADRPWGMREFGVRTPDGHRFMVGATLAG